MSAAILCVERHSCWQLRGFNFLWAQDGGGERGAECVWCCPVPVCVVGGGQQDQDCGEATSCCCCCLGTVLWCRASECTTLNGCFSGGDLTQVVSNQRSTHTHTTCNLPFDLSTFSLLRKTCGRPPVCEQHDHSWSETWSHDTPRWSQVSANYTVIRMTPLHYNLAFSVIG